MKKIFMFITFLLTLASITYSQLNVVTTYPYIADIVQRVGKEKVQVTALARGDYNPHVIVPKPSYIAKLRKADLLIINGAQLEIGWLPPILKQANNGTIQPGEKGFLDLASRVHLIEVPKNVSREMGDVHPEGNPHFCLSPDNIPVIATAIAQKLSELDPANASAYEANKTAFLKLWEQKASQWQKAMEPLKGTKVIEYHKIFDYFIQHFGLSLAGTVEPLPGIPPTTKHVAEVEQTITRDRIRFILQDVYNPKDASQYLAQRTGAKLLVLPHDVGAVKEAADIIALFDEIVRRITQ